MAIVTTVFVTPAADCKACHGTGVVTDWVPTPFGHGNCRMESLCDCVTEQVDDDDAEIEIVLQSEVDDAAIYDANVAEWRKEQEQA